MKNILKILYLKIYKNFKKLKIVILKIWDFIINIKIRILIYTIY